MRIILIRHTISKQNLKSLLKDDSNDEGLSSAGVAQAKKLRSLFENSNFHSLYVSPAKRCQQTAEIIFPKFKNKYLVSSELREINKGFAKIIKENPSLGLMTVQEWEKKYNRLNGSKAKNNFKYPSGESIDKMMRRVSYFLKCLTEQKMDGELAIVSHNGPIKAIIAVALKNKKLFQFITCDNGCYSELSYDNGEFILRKLNAS